MPEAATTQRVRVLTHTALGGIYSRDVVVRVRPMAYEVANTYGAEPVETFFLTVVETLRTEGVPSAQLDKLCLFDMYAVSADGTASFVTEVPPHDSLVYFGAMSVDATRAYTKLNTIAPSDATSERALCSKDPQDLVVYKGTQCAVLPFPTACSIKELYAYISEHVGVSVTKTRLRTLDGLMMNWSGRRATLHYYGLSLYDDASVVVEH